jgi:methanogenic corrinoid protein MtbC1
MQPKPPRFDAQEGQVYDQNHSRQAAVAWGEPAELASRHAGALVPEEAAGSRSRLAHLVQTLEHDVIPRLVRLHRGEGTVAASALAAADFERFVQHVIDGSEAQTTECIDVLRRRGVPVDVLFLDLLAPAARRLGVLWEDDRCDFSSVTVGVGRLHRLMRELSPAFGREVAHAPHGRRILLVQPDADQHIFGLSMVAEFFRRAGWSVDGGVAGSGIDPVSAVRREWFDVVGFSLGSDKHVAWVASRIAGLRRTSRNSAVSVLVGGSLFTVRPEWAERVGADALVTDGGRAAAVAEALLAVQAKSGAGSTRPG